MPPSTADLKKKIGHIGQAGFTASNGKGPQRGCFVSGRTDSKT